MAPGGVNKETGRGVAPAYPAGHNLATVSIIVTFWWALDGGGGWVVSLMVVVGRKKQYGNVWATAATFGMTGAKGGIYFPFFCPYNTIFMAQLALALLFLQQLRVQFVNSVKFIFT